MKRRGQTLLIAGVVLSFFFVVPVRGAIVDEMQFYLQGWNAFYEASSPHNVSGNSEFFLDEDYTWDSSLMVGRILLESGADVAPISIIREVLGKGKPTNKTIFAVVADKETLQKAINVVRSLCGDLNEPGKGILFTLKLDFVEGLKKANFREQL